MKNRLLILVTLVVNSAIAYYLFIAANNYRLAPYKEVGAQDAVILKIEDLDGDGSSEEVLVRDYNNIYSIFNIRSKEGHVSDLKIEGKIKSERAILFYDTNKDGVKDLWSITRYRDTLWLNYSDLYSKIASYAIVAVDKNYSLENYDYLVEIAGFHEDLLFFSINAGYPLEPRAVYSFSLKTEEFRRTRDEGSLMVNPYLFDLDKDGTPEIITRSFAPENIHYDVPYTDSSTWLRIFDLKLNHVFPPKEYPFGTSKITVLPVVTDSSNYIAVSSRYGRTEDVNPSISLVNNLGEIVIENESNQSKRLFQNGKDIYTYNEVTSKIHSIDERLMEDRFMMEVSVPLNPLALGKNTVEPINFLLASAQQNNLSVISNDLRTEFRYSLNQPIIGHPIWDKETIAVRTADKMYFFHIERKSEFLNGIIFLLIASVQLGVFFFVKKIRSNTSKNREDYLILKSSVEKIKVPFNEIFFLETTGEGPYTNIYLVREEKPILMTKNIGTIEKELTSQFIRISRSIIVRKDLIKAVKKRERIVVLCAEQKEAILKVSKSRIGDLPF